jgi:4-oxalocrotonate tautomerase
MLIGLCGLNRLIAYCHRSYIASADRNRSARSVCEAESVSIRLLFARAPERKSQMPHVIVKLYAGRSEQQKVKLAEAITKAVMSSLDHSEDAVSVALEDVRPTDWVEKVYKPDILGKAEQIYKKPGYDPFS